MAHNVMLDHVKYHQIYSKLGCMSCDVRVTEGSNIRGVVQRIICAQGGRRRKV